MIQMGQVSHLAGMVVITISNIQKGIIANPYPVMKMPVAGHRYIAIVGYALIAMIRLEKQIR